MIKDGIAAHAGKPIYPTRLHLRATITTPAQAKTFDTIAFDPLNPKYAYMYKKYFKYLDDAGRDGTGSARAVTRRMSADGTSRTCGRSPFTVAGRWERGR